MGAASSAVGRRRPKATAAVGVVTAFKHAGIVEERRDSLLRESKTGLTGKRRIKAALAVADRPVLRGQAARESKQKSASSFKVGQTMDVLDVFRSKHTGEKTWKWRDAEVLEIGPAPGVEVGQRLKIRFVGWGSKCDIWLLLPQDLDRIRRVATSSLEIRLEDVNIGQSLLVKDYFTVQKTGQRAYKWRNAKVLETREVDVQGGTMAELLVHYDKWSSEWDAWVPLTAERVRMKRALREKKANARPRKQQGHSSNSSSSGRRLGEDGRRGGGGGGGGSSRSRGAADVETMGAREAATRLDVSSSRRRSRASTSSSTNRSTNSSSSSSSMSLSTSTSTSASSRMARKSPRDAYYIMRMPALPEGGGLVGLSNLGNTCFMNSCLQCLAHIPQLADYFLREGHTKDLNTSSSSKGKLANAFASLVNDLWTGRAYQAVRPNRVKSVIGRYASRFIGYEQHDVQEFLRFFLDGLHEDLNRIRDKPAYEEIKDMPNEADAVTADRWWRNYEQRNSSHIKDVFCGQLRSEVICKTCGHRSLAFDPFWDLSVPIGTHGLSKSCSIESCLRSFASREDLSGEDKYYCPKCKKHRTSSKQMAIWRLPQVLVVHTKRFLNTRWSRKKIDARVKFPAEGLNLDSTGCIFKGREEGRDARYKLVGVSNHMGSLRGGHYTADCLCHQSWYRFNDSSVTTMSRDFDHSSAYLLFYVRTR